MLSRFSGGVPAGRYILQTNFNDFLTPAQTGEFLWFGLRSLNITESSTQSLYPIAATLTEIAIELTGNNLDVASVNTLTLRKEGSDTTFILVIPDTFTGTIIHTGLESFAAGDIVVMRWDTNSVGGSCNMKGLGGAGRAP